MTIMTPLWLLLVMVGVEGAPLAHPHDLEPIIDSFLEKLYEEVHQEKDIYDQMQGDQPDNNIQGDLSKFLSVNFSQPTNLTEYFRTSRNRPREIDTDDRAKDNWIKVLKENILQQLGRTNMTATKAEESRMNAMNISVISRLFNSTVIEDDQITEKIRSYYPSCDVPSNMDQDVWKDENIMNLYFNSFDHGPDEKGLNIATATLRLYRVRSENSTKLTGKNPDCDSSSASEEDKLLRVSIYWYTKSLRKKKLKRRLSDSKVIPENASWVELSVKPATKAWGRGKNLGLAVLVEDQEGNVLKADRLFKGALCMVGASTPKPIPTIIIDAARQSNELDQRIHSLLGGNSTSSLSGNIPMLPTIDICTLEFPENYSHPPPHIAHLRTNACNLRKSQEHAQWLAEMDRYERFATLPEPQSLPLRHIRHQRQHLKQFDPRSKIVNKRVLTQEELQALNITVDR